MKLIPFFLKIFSHNKSLKEKSHFYWDWILQVLPNHIEQKKKKKKDLAGRGAGDNWAQEIKGAKISNLPDLNPSSSS